MGSGHGKKRPLPGGETSESKRGSSRRVSPVVDASVLSKGGSSHPSTEQVSVEFLPPTCGCDEMPAWRDDSYSEEDSEAYIISNILEGHYSSADKPSACNSVSEALRSFGSVDAASKLGGSRSAGKGNRFVEFEQNRSWARSVANRRSAAYASEHCTLSRPANGFLILHHGSIEETGISHASQIRAQWDKLDGSAAGKQVGGNFARSHYGIPMWNLKDQSFRKDYSVHQNDSGMQVKETTSSHSPTFAIFLGKIVSDYSASLSANESSRLGISVDQAGLDDHRASARCNVPPTEGVSSLPGLQEPEPDTSRDLPSGEFQNERRFISYVNSSGRLILKEEPREPTIDHEFEERFSALLLS